MTTTERALIDAPRLQDAVACALETAAAAGAAQAEAAASTGQGLTATVRLGEVETLEFHLDQSFGVTVYVEGRKGSASTSALDEGSLRETVTKAISIAGLTEPDPCAGLADADRMAQQRPDLGLDHPWGLEAEDAVLLATRCEDAARGHDARISNSEGASVTTGRSLRCYGNSHGFLGESAGTSHSISCSVLAEQDGRMERDYHYDSRRDPAALALPETVGEEAARRTLRRLGSERLSTRRAPVLLPPELARGLFGHLVAAVRGRAQYQQASFLLGAVGRQVLPDWLTVSERPHLPGAFGSSAFDDEGVATEERALVDAGVLTGYLLSSYSARRLGLETTGHAGRLHNLEFSTTHSDLDALAAEMGEGLLVTELIGQGVNLVTGDYSRGAAGFWVEGGVPVRPVSEVTIAGDLADMLLGIVGVGADLDTRGPIRSGSLLLSEMTIAGE